VIALAAILIVVFSGLGLAKAVAAAPMRAAAQHMGFTLNQYRAIGVLELAGAAGIAIGISVPLLGLAASVGLALLMAGACAAHFRNRDPFGRVAIPLVAGTLLVAYAVALSN
jgi:hypothetical protein